MSKENDEEEMEFREEKGRIRLDTESKITEGGMQSQESYGSCMLIVVKKKSSRKEIQLNWRDQEMKNQMKRHITRISEMHERGHEDVIEIQ